MNMPAENQFHGIQIMPILLSLLFIFLLISENAMSADNPVAIVIHGGAGTIIKEKMSRDIEDQYRQSLAESVKVGYQILKNGGSSIAAVTAAIQQMENSPLYNAGKGAVFTHDGKNEMDASIMEGKFLNAGAIAGVSRVKNPIALAAEVLTNSEHVLLAGKGAESFALQQGIELVDPDYFFTQRRWQQLQDVRGEVDPDVEKSAQQNPSAGMTRLSEHAMDHFEDNKFGTVGAVALDNNGTLAAGTSTGGMTNKRFGRVGDSPIIGAGTYADNGSCGISATGHGEFFIRAVVAQDICARVKYKGQSLQEAADEVVQGKLVRMGGEGGVIGMDSSGNIAYSFNTSGMYRASIDIAGQLEVEIFR
jgi:beta-aspartyl-peptidase (threonine type)